ncbi:Crp/Fnr family transcriptional regulator [Alistipes sp.]|uniref:Crp/Fnr family transcriptional regulator n=1 Tax=Alistipes sp. TaxID=1872444 RepID=UPI003AF17E64
MDFRERLVADHALSPRSADLLMQQAQRREYPARAEVVREGERNPWVWFVEAGAVRTYVLREAKCVILQFAFEGEAAAAGFGSEKSARYTIETLEPTTLVRFPRERLEALFAAEAELANWARRTVERTLRSHEDYFADYCWMDKGRQYERLLDEYPQLLRRVPLKDLASWLFITPQTLSRIRAEIK